MTALFVYLKFKRKGSFFMAEAKQNKNGTWTVLVYSHTITQNGKPKRIYQRFTSDKKKECEQMAKEFEVNRKYQKLPTGMTVSEAIQKYIDLKSNILSPSTIRAYRIIQKSKYPLIGHIRLNKLTNEMIQSEINQEAAKHSPKYIRNIYALLTASLEMFAPEFHTHFSYPDCRKKDISIPSAADINALLAASPSDDQSLAVKLAAFLGLRRGEICGLHVDDIDLWNEKISVRRSVVLTPEKKWIEKVPKTKAGRRDLLIPAVLRADLEKAVEGKAHSDKLLSISPSQISDSFETMRKQAKINYCTFHALRHYYASVMLANNVPNKYAMEMMGHETENMLNRVYQHTMSEKKKKVASQIDAYFSETFLQ